MILIWSLILIMELTLEDRQNREILQIFRGVRHIKEKQSSDIPQEFITNLTDIPRSVVIVYYRGGVGIWHPQTKILI